MTSQRRSEQACLARQDLGHTHIAHVLEYVTIIDIDIVIAIIVIIIITVTDAVPTVKYVNS